MTAYAPISPRPADGFSRGDAVPLGMRLRAWLKERRRRARLARELAQLDDRDLTDLGIGRADFPAIIRGTYRR